jgi:hypothetical protein
VEVLIELIWVTAGVYFNRDYNSVLLAEVGVTQLLYIYLVAPNLLSIERHLRLSSINHVSRIDFDSNISSYEAMRQR